MRCYGEIKNDLLSPGSFLTQRMNDRAEMWEVPVSLCACGCERGCAGRQGAGAGAHGRQGLCGPGCSYWPWGERQPKCIMNRVPWDMMTSWMWAGRGDGSEKHCSSVPGWWAEWQCTQSNQKTQSSKGKAHLSQTTNCLVNAKKKKKVIINQEQIQKATVTRLMNASEFLAKS